MIFPKSKEKSLSDDLFKNPTNEYRGEPFWAWNNSLDKEKLTGQLDYFEEMGIGGFHMHCRTGLDTEYMSDAFLDYIKAVVQKAKEKNMKAYLYDEDRWPSGFAGGLVTKDEKFRARYIAFSPFKKDEIVETELNDSSSCGAATKKGKLVAKYDVDIQNGFLKSYRRLSENEDGKNVWYAYLEVSNESPWFNNQTYVDTLNKEAIEKFVEVTHDRYYKCLKDYIGDTVPSIFTDEPQFTNKGFLGFAEEKKNVILPYTDKFEQLYNEEYHESFLDKLPEVVWELPDGKVSVTRYHYHDFVSELFASSFADTVGGWCKEHNLLLTGHMMEEPTLQSQTAALGEAMRSYRSFGLPGIDMLCDNREYSTAKQAQSASHQFGCEGVLSELYGVTGWDFDFRGHKQQGDWQAVLGVTNRVHHLSWYSMEGEAKRDYPAAIFYQSPWYKEYKMIEDHFARVYTAMTRGKPIVKIGVIHPVESYWLHFGPAEQTNSVRSEMEDNFSNTIKWLLSNQLDFDFISESLLPIQNSSVDSDKFTVGEMQYDTVVVPALETMRSSTLERLEKFRANGGNIVFLGNAPTLIDAIPSDRGIKLADKCKLVSFTKAKIVNSLKDNRIIELRYGNGNVAENLFYQLRKDNDCEWLFIANAEKRKGKQTTDAKELTIRIKGYFDALLYDTMSGEIKNLASSCENGLTTLKIGVCAHDSILLKLIKSSEHRNDLSVSWREIEKEIHLSDSVKYSLSEPNALLLDKAEYSFDGSEWYKRNDLFLIDDDFRELIGFPSRRKNVAQPWVMKDEEKSSHILGLRFRIESLADVKNVELAIERPENCEIYFDGKLIEEKPHGYYVDECLKKINIGKIKKGENIIEIKMPFTKKCNVEWLYLLGDFGVKLYGDKAVICEKEPTIPFGDFTQYNLPFYTGNLDYECNAEVEEGEYALQICNFVCPLISVKVDGEDKGKIAFEPYTVNLGHLSAGKHNITVTAFGHRYNGFGAVHNCDDTFTYHGPDAWRKTGERYSQNYFLKKMGVLREPVLQKLK